MKLANYYYNKSWKRLIREFTSQFDYHMKKICILISRVPKKKKKS